MTLEELRWAKTKDGLRLALTTRWPVVSPRGVALLVHGFSQNRHAFLRGGIPQVLCDEGLVVMVAELRGHGLSDRPQTWTLEELLEGDLPALEGAARGLGLGAPHLIAHSMGGMLGFASLAGRGSWASLTAIAAPIQLGRGSPLVGIAARAVTPAAWLGRRRRVPMDAFLGALAPTLSARGARLPLRQAQRVLALANPEEADPALLREVLEASDPESMDVFRAFLRFARRGRGRLLGVDLAEAVRSTTIPVATINGGRDIFAPPASMAQLSKGRHQGPRRQVVLPSASHVDLTVGPRVARTVEGLLSFLEVP